GQTHIALVLRHPLPLHSIAAEIDLLRSPLLALPSIIEFTVSRQVYQSLVDDMQYIIDRRLLQLHQRSVFKRRINGHVASLALSYRSSPRHYVAMHTQTQSRWAFYNSPAHLDNKLSVFLHSHRYASRRRL